MRLPPVLASIFLVVALDVCAQRAGSEVPPLRTAPAPGNAGTSGSSVADIAATSVEKAGESGMKGSRSLGVAGKVAGKAVGAYNALEATESFMRAGDCMSAGDVRGFSKNAAEGAYVSAGIASPAIGLAQSCADVAGNALFGRDVVKESVVGTGAALIEAGIEGQKRVVEAQSELARQGFFYDPMTGAYSYVEGLAAPATHSLDARRAAAGRDFRQVEAGNVRAERERAAIAREQAAAVSMSVGAGVAGDHFLGFVNQLITIPGLFTPVGPVPASSPPRTPPGSGAPGGAGTPTPGIPFTPTEHCHRCPPGRQCGCK